jgi:hypothetical protein
MSNYLKPAARQHFPDGSSFNPNLGTVTFGLTLPVKAAQSFMEDERPSPKCILNCLARSIETQKNQLAQAALRAVFDCIYDRTTAREREMFPNWFESQ